MGEISVPIDRIVPLTDARDNFSRIVADIENSQDGLYVLTKGGKPAIALISIQKLEHLMGGHAESKQPEKKETKPEPSRVSAKSSDRTPNFDSKLHAAPSFTLPKAPIYDAASKPAETAPPPSQVTKPTIDPSWTGVKPDAIPAESSQSPSTSTPPTERKPVSPWPILPPKPTNNLGSATPTTPLDNLVNPSAGGSVVSPPAPVTSPSPAALPTPASVTPPKEAFKPQAATPTPPAPTLQPSVNPDPINTQPDLPPPPNNPTTIPFDEPPKISTDSVESNAPVPAAPAVTPPAAAPQPVQDLEI